MPEGYMTYIHTIIIITAVEMMTVYDVDRKQWIAIGVLLLIVIVIIILFIVT